MVGENQWISVGPGLVIYVSFINGDNDMGDSVVCLKKVVKSLINAKLATSSGWISDHSDAESIANLVSQSENVTNLVVIPQATLAGKLKLGDKYLKYHRQVEKEKSFNLYSLFLDELAGYFDPVKSINHPSSSSLLEIIPGKLNLIWGTFGNRQGFEFVSTGPSTHYFEF